MTWIGHVITIEVMIVADQGLGWLAGRIRIDLP
jgi:hypothetical protein